MSKFSNKSLVELSNQQSVNLLSELVNNMSAKTLAQVKELATRVAFIFEKDLITIGKRSLVTACASLEDLSFDEVQSRAKALVKAVSIFCSKEDSSNTNSFNPETEVLAYRRKCILLNALKCYLSEASLEEGELEIAQGLVSKTSSVLVSIEINILSKYAKGLFREVYDKHLNFNETMTKIVSFKGGN